METPRSSAALAQSFQHLERSLPGGASFDARTREREFTIAFRQVVRSAARLS